MTAIEAKSFDHDCAGLLDAIAIALETPHRDDTYDGFITYYGHVETRAAWHARHVYRRARRLGLLASYERKAAA